ncbi:MAG: helix-turn-helix transcriptional regulator [Spirochaetales bacterium]|nr:helix-turn-helix transcriptional regulator [Candidatus Physcosoma equi]
MHRKAIRQPFKRSYPIKNTPLETIPLISLPLKTYSNKVNAVIAYIWRSYWMLLDLSEAAEMVQISPQHLSSLFKETTGMTFVKYYNSLRVNRAAWLLVYTNEEIRTISHTCGFESTSYFIRVFRETTGKTPLRYRKEVTKALNAIKRNQSTE